MSQPSPDPVGAVRTTGNAAAGGAAGLPADDAELAAVREVRAAVRALFTHAVRPAPPARSHRCRHATPSNG